MGILGTFQGLTARREVSRSARGSSGSAGNILSAKWHETCYTCQMAPCTIDGCERPRKARGLCATHYMRQRRHGDTSTVKASGRPRGPARAAVGAIFDTYWGGRTIDRYDRAQRILAALTVDDIITSEEVTALDRAAFQASTRPNGTVNVLAYLERVEDIAAMIVAEQQQVEDIITMIVAQRAAVRADRR